LAYKNSLTLVDLVKKAGLNYQFRETNHGHWWGAWRMYLSELAPQLFK
jgi:hypothetical protein